MSHDALHVNVDVDVADSVNAHPRIQPDGIGHGPRATGHEWFVDVNVDVADSVNAHPRAVRSSNRTDPARRTASICRSRGAIARRRTACGSCPAVTVNGASPAAASSRRSPSRSRRRCRR